MRPSLTARLRVSAFVLVVEPGPEAPGPGLAGPLSAFLSGRRGPMAVRGAQVDGRAPLPEQDLQAFLGVLVAAQPPVGSAALLPAGVDQATLAAAAPLRRAVEKAMARTGARAAETVQASAELEEAAAEGGGLVDLEWALERMLVHVSGAGRMALLWLTGSSRCGQHVVIRSVCEANVGE